MTAHVRRLCARLWNVRTACRTPARTPRFAAVAVLTMALGIGANTAVFSVVHSLLLQPLPFPDADQLVRRAGGHLMSHSTSHSGPQLNLPRVCQNRHE